MQGREKRARLEGRKIRVMGQTDRQLGCCFPILIGVAKGRCSTARTYSDMVPSTTCLR